ncbi:GIY-YIG nuclease family protein [Sphingomonas sp. CROZ-RG-20F-R02-07]|uniref:GIY-YIG nuclease family protein n=1 Tax=Sphingomonas sp. CROZ-RG-20F-R02-07 TaxID=2914832 RepID=UPI001F5A9F92|nr:GIY-YIG nuclease family protein [Sphingomonas sp. CROZ-RG-20F-R02-07]
MENQAFVYIMANHRNGAIYLGSTTNLARRVWEHRNGVVAGFTKRYGCKALVWYEACGEWEAARLRERQMKEWRRTWKVQEIEGLNPAWNDLYDRIAQP